VTSKVAALLSSGAALVIVVATFWQWWDITYDGDMKMRGWVRYVLAVAAVALFASAVLLIIGD
jgi:hypothetical protein